jgi:hypothetical protein
VGTGINKGSASPSALHGTYRREAGSLSRSAALLGTRTTVLLDMGLQPSLPLRRDPSHESYGPSQCEHDVPLFHGVQPRDDVMMRRIREVF